MLGNKEFLGVINTKDRQRGSSVQGAPRKGDRQPGIDEGWALKRLRAHVAEEVGLLRPTEERVIAPACSLVL